MKQLLLFLCVALACFGMAAQPVTFTSQTVNLNGYKGCVVDMNNDYLDDIVATNSASVNILYQNPNGGFTSATLATPPAVFSPSWSISAGDIDGNGYNDLLYADQQGVSFMKQNSTGTAFTQMSDDNYVFCQRSNFVDINGDGNLDAFVCHDVQPNVYYLNDGNGNYSFHQGGLGDFPEGGNYGSVWVDYDNDGDPDLFIAKCRGGNSGAKIDELHRNNGDGTFTNVNVAAGMAEPSQSWSSAWADYDNDGDMDALIGASSFTDGGHKLRRNNGNGTFTDVSAGSGFEGLTATTIEYTAHDFNNDGFVDVFAGGHTIMMNNGNMTFTALNVTPGSGPTGDLNNDGFLDIQNGSSVYYNDGNPNKWVKVTLQGVESNRNGLGGRVEIHGPWGVQIRDIRSGEGFEYMSSLNAHFGIGAATSIAKVVVKWPSGVVDEILNPSTNSTVFVLEGSSPPLGTNDVSALHFSISPNPVKDVVRFNFSTQTQITSATVFDLSGRSVLSASVSDNQLSTQQLSVGTYVIQLKDINGKNYVQKFIKE